MTEKGFNRLKKSFAILLWHILGQPQSWGLEDMKTGMLKIQRNGYTWFLPEGASIPEQAANPKEFMDEFNGEVLNLSRTTFVKTGMLDGKIIFLKRYNFKGIRDTIKNFFRKSRARRSYEAAVSVYKSGINTPRVLFACEKRPCGILIESYIATEKIDAVDLVSYVQTRGCSDALLRSLARFVRQLHEMGIVHVDFKGENILVGKNAFHLIDLDRLKRTYRLDLEIIAKNLSYLNASFARDIPCETRMTFLDEYLKGNTWLEGKGLDLTEKVKAYTQRRLARRYNDQN